MSTYAVAHAFDQVAPKLLLLGLRLVRDPHTAEDLVQATFLRALEVAERFDPNRPLLPWLAGILTNEARMSRRRARRVVDPTLLELDAAADPADEAQILELADAVSLALDGLPRPYREVAVLHLVHGLRSTDIAQRLRRSPKTVNSQLRRGIAMLRQALPAGFAAGLLAYVSAGQSLVAVRERVFAAAGVEPTPVGTSAAAGWNVSHIMTLALVAIVATLGVAGMIGLKTPTTADAKQAAPPMAAGGMLAGENALEGRDSSALAEPPREAIASPPLKPTTLTVEVVWKGDEAPAEGVWVRATPAEPDQPLAEDLCRRVGADGLAVFDPMPAGPCIVTFSHGGPRLPSFWVRPGTDNRVQLQLDHDLELYCSVIDARGHPVPQAEIWAGDSAASNLIARTDDRGRCIVKGNSGMAVGARAPGYAPSRLQPAPPPDGQRAVKLRLQLPGPGATLEGVVLDAGGRPAAGAKLRIDLRTGLNHLVQSPIELSADDRGRWRAADLPPGDRLVLARFPGHSLSFATCTAVAGQTRSVELRLAPGATVQGALHDADGDPVAHAKIAAYARELAAIPLGAPTAPHPILLRLNTHQLVSTDDQGRFRLAGLPAGRIALELVSGTPTSLEQVVVTEGQHLDLELRLPPGASSSWSIVGEARQAGVPMPDWSVVMAFASSAATAALSTDPWRDRQFLHQVHAQTNQQGRFRSDRGARQLLAAYARPPAARDPYPGALVEGFTVAGQPLVLEVAPPAEVLVRVVDDRGEPLANADLRLWHTVLNLIAVVAVTDAQGVARSAPLPAGTYGVAIAHAAHFELPLGEHALAAGTTQDLGTVVLGEPGALQLRPRFEPGLQPRAGLGIAITDADGKQPLRLDRLPPGTYFVTLQAPGLAEVRIRVEVTPGDPTVVDIPVRRGYPTRLRLELPTPNPADLLEAELRQAGQPPLLLRMVALAAGGAPGTSFGCDVTLAAGAYEVSVDDGGILRRGAFDVFASDAVQDLTVGMR